MIRRVAVVPTPPLLVPELVPGTGPETSGVRDAAVEAAAWLCEVSEDWIAVGTYPGAGGPLRGFEPSACGSFAGYGVDVPVALARAGAGQPDPELPLPVLVAGWLRARAGAASVAVSLVPELLSTPECLALGRRLDTGVDTALLVLGDGSHRHGDRAPARPDARATEFDATVAAALADVDEAALAAVDPGVAAELGAAGRAAWQVAAGVLAAGRWRGKLRYSDVPFGVAYHVATWELEKTLRREASR